MSSQRLPEYAEALAAALSCAAALDGCDRVALAAATGRVLAKGIRADRDLPPFDRAQMDGYALRASEFNAAEPNRPWPVVARIAAGQRWSGEVPPDSCVAIATGAAVPPGLDSIIQHELSDRADLRLGSDHVRFTTARVELGHAVHQCASDARAGTTLIEPGTVLSAHHLGLCAAVGCTEMAVTPRPRVIVLTSGDEVVHPDTPTNQLEPQQIRNSNGPMLRDLVQRMGATCIDHHHVPDHGQATIAAVGQSLERCDILLTVGGVSVGERDHFPQAFEHHRVSFKLRGAAIQPGKPVMVGATGRGTVVIALPGNPVSALACACLFLWPALRVMLGLAAELPWRNVKLVEAVKPNPHRRAFRPARLVDFDAAIVPHWAGSGDLAHTAQTDGLLELPPMATLLNSGTTLRFLPWP